MASTSEVKAGEAYVEGRVKDNTAEGISKIEKRLKNLGQNFKEIGEKMLVAGGIIIGAFVPAIKAAGDLEKTIQKFHWVFGEQSDAVMAWGDELAKQVGRSKNEIFEFLAGTKHLIIPLGFDDAQANEMSKTLTKLAIDLASFNNVSDEDSLQALKSGLEGLPKALKMYGVLVDEAAVKTKLLEKGIKDTDATDQEKILARYAIILERTSFAQGDAARSAQTFTNSWKRLQAGATDMAASIGTAVLPMVKSLISKATTAAAAIGTWAKENPSLLTSILKLGVALVTVGAAFYGLGVVSKTTFAVIEFYRAVVKTISPLKLLVGAIDLVKAASIALVTTPVGIIMLGIAVAVGAAIYAWHKYGDAVDEVSKKQDDLLDKGDQKRTADQTALARLEQLNQKTKLNSDEQEEAADIIADLSGKYDDLGLSIDGATGKIVGLTQAQAKAREAMKAAAEDEINASIFEQENNLEKAQNKAAHPGFGAYATNTITFNSVDSVGDAQNAAADKALLAMKRLQALNKRLEALRAGDADAITGKGVEGDTGLKARMEKTEAAIKEEARLQDQLKELKDQQIEDTYLREIALINDKYDLELKRLKELGADTAASDEMRDIELGAAAKKRENDDDDARKKEIEDAKKAVKERAQALKDQVRDQTSEYNSLLMSALEAEESQTKKRGGSTKVLDDQIKELKRKMEDQDFDAEAERLGITDSQKQTFKDLINRKRFAEDAAGSATTTFGAIGTFNSSAIQALRGSGETVAERTAKATEETAKNTKNIAKKKTLAFT